MITPPRSGKRRRTNNGGFSVRNVANAAVQAAAGYMRRSAGTQTTRTKKSVNYGGITTQHDERKLYRKKRMPRRKKKAWKKFKSKVNAVEISNRGLISRIFNAKIGINVPGQAQRWLACHLYGIAGQANSQEIGESDMSTLFLNDDNVRRITTTVGSAMARQQLNQLTDRIRMQSATMDIVLENLGDFPLIVDCYHLWYTQESIYTNLASCLIGGVATTQPITTDGATYEETPNIDLYGTSLFDLSRAISSGAIKVMSVKQYLLGSNQIVTDQIRDAKNYNMNPHYLTNTGVWAKPKYTETLLFIAKNQRNSSEDVTTFNVTSTRHYRYSIEGITQDFGNYEIKA